jgi:hypothetical protein
MRVESFKDLLVVFFQSSTGSSFQIYPAMFEITGVIPEPIFD